MKSLRGQLAAGGWLAQVLGYHAAFFILGSFALVSVGLRVGFGGTLRPVRAAAGDRPPEANA